jgi:hypothetical protein
MEPRSPSPSRSHPAFGSTIDTRRCETAKLVVLRLKTSNNRSYQNLQIGIRLLQVLSWAPCGFSVS